MSLKRKMAQAALVKFKQQRKKVLKELGGQDQENWTEESKAAFNHILGELSGLKDDVARAKFCMVYAKGIYNTGQVLMKRKMQEEIDKLEYELAKFMKPKIELAR